MAYEIQTALIGFGGGILPSVIAPWVKWGFERLSRKHDRRVQLVERWRAEIRQLRNAEQSCIARNQEQATNGLPELDDLREADPTNHEWFRDLKPELSDETLATVEQLRLRPVKERRGEIPDLLENEVRRIERGEWKLL